MTTRDVVYARSHLQDGMIVERVMDVHQPMGCRDTARPAVIYIHGNPGDSPYPGGRHHRAVHYARMFTRRGWAAFVISWGLRQGGAEAFVQVKSAVRHVRANAESYKVDPNRIAVLGNSYGGSWAIALAVTDDEHGAPCPADQADPANHWGVSARVQAAIAVPGGVFFEEECDERDAPVFYARGTEDKNFRVPEHRVAALEAGGVPYAWFPVEGAGHGIRINQEVAFDRTLETLIWEFLAIHLLEGGDTSTVMLHLTHSGNGRITMDPENGLVPKGTTVTLSAEPAQGHRFVRWQGDVDGDENPTAVPADDNKTISAVFEPLS